MENQDYEALYNAVRYNDLEKPQDLVEHGVDINTQGKSGQTALMLAARSKHIEIVKYLANNLNIDLNATDAFGKTVIDWCSTNEIKQVLLEASQKQKIAEVKSKLHQPESNGTQIPQTPTKENTSTTSTANQGVLPNINRNNGR